MESENLFYEGMDLDTDPLLVSPKRSHLNLNCRQVDIAGRGFVNQNMNGNEFNPLLDIGFELTAGFVPIGKVSYLGVAFIFSQHADGRGEIGTYPSPSVTGNGGFDKVYRPLQNYLTDALGFTMMNPYLLAYTLRTVNGFDWGSAGHLAFLMTPGRRQPFTTTLFNWQQNYKLRAVAREDYDGSANLYFVDGNNSDRVINCGFNIKTGAYNVRTYFDLSFEQVINQLNETLWPIELRDPNSRCPVTVQNNGSFKCGNVTFYFRYANENFNHTSFVGHSEAVMIVPTDDNTLWAQTIQGGSGTKETNKSVLLRFDNTILDRSYRFMQIAYVRNIENGGFEVQLISKYYEVQELLVNPLVEVTNNEPKEILTIADIIKIKRRDDISRDINDYESRLFHANTKTNELYKEDLRNFALNITGTFTDRIRWQHPIQLTQLTAGNNLVSGTAAYKDYRNVYLHIGYFRKEWYPINVQYLLKTGKWTDGFPVTGHDYYRDPVGGNIAFDNSNGLFRAHSADVSRPVRSVSGNFGDAGSHESVAILGLEFTIDGTNLTDWMKDNVVGMRIVRAKRIENLVYQGLSTSVFKSYGTNVYRNNACWPQYDCKGLYPCESTCEATDSYSNPWKHFLPFRWNKNEWYNFIATTRLFPNFNLQQIAQDHDRPRKYDCGGVVDRGMYDLMSNGKIPGQNRITRAVFPWIMIFFTKQPGKGCGLDIQPNSGMNHSAKGVGLHADDDGFWPIPSGKEADWRCANASLPSEDGLLVGDTLTGTFHQRKLALFSPDFAIKQIFIDKEYFIQRIADYTILPDTGYAPGNPNPPRNTKDFVYLKEGIYAPQHAVGPNSDQNGTRNGWDLKYEKAQYYERMLNIRGFFWDSHWMEYTPIWADGQTYKRAKVYGVQQFTSHANHQFASYANEGTGADMPLDWENNPGDDDSTISDGHLGNSSAIAATSSDLIFYYGYGRNKKAFQVTIKNSSFGTCAYLGLDFSGLPNNDLPVEEYWKLMNVYRRDPETDDQAEWSSKGENFFPIGDFIRFSQSFPLNMAFRGLPGVPEVQNFRRYQGDCFLQRTYMKTLGNPTYNVGAKGDDNLTGFSGAGYERYTFGNIVGMITENSTNTGVRHEEERTGAGADIETFYPLHNTQDPHDFAGDVKGKESWRYNDGYSHILCHQSCIGYDDQMPFAKREYPTRIWWSNEHVVGAIQDSWLKTELTSHRDFDAGSGPIVRVTSGKGKFYSIYEHGIKMHFVNERELNKSAGGEAALVLGVQADVMSPKAYNISDEVGVQQMDAMQESDDAFYGFDMQQPEIWRVKFGTYTKENLSVAKNVLSETVLMENAASSIIQTDVTSTFPDEAIVTKGIVLAYDRSNSDMYIGLALNQPDLATNQCLIFNEKQDRFSTKTNWCPSFHLLINDDFYMVNYDFKERFYLSDRVVTGTGIPNASTFFGILQPTQMSVICNKGKYSSYTGIFDAIRIIGNYITPQQIEYFNEYQVTAIYPFNTGATPKYLVPFYRENAWRVAIPRAAVTAFSHYLPDSHMRSQHIKIKLTYLSNLPIFVKSIITSWRPSKT